MNEWIIYKLKDLCSDIIDCINKTAPISQEETPYKMLRTSDVRDGRINLEGLNSVTETVFETWTRRGKLNVGDIVFTREAPLGEVGLVRVADNYFLGQRLVLFRANPEVCDNKFLLYSLLHHDNKQAIISKGVGSTVLHLRVPECENITIKAPKLSIQKRIGEILSTYDDLIANNQKQIKLLEEAAQRLYKEWFIDLHFPGHENCKIVDGVPEGWSKYQFSEKVDVMSGGTPKTSNPHYYNGEIPFYTPKDSTEDFFSFDTITKITEEGVLNSNTKVYPINTVIITARGTVGKITILAKPMAMNQSCYALKSDELNTPYYLYFSLKQEINKLQAMANGGVFDTIIIKTFDSISITIPNESILIMFNEKISPIMEQIKTKMIGNFRLQEARDRLLPKLMSGEIEL